MGLFGGLLGGLFSNDGFDDGIFSSGPLITTNRGVMPDMGEKMRKIMKDSDTPVGDLCRTIDDIKDEFHELVTEGFVEMVIKGNADYKTSFEMKEEADEKITWARDRYQERCHAFNEYLNALNTMINDLYELKIKLAERIQAKIRKRAALPSYSMRDAAPSYSYAESTISKICACMSIWHNDIAGRKESAREYLEDAQDYEVYVDAKIAEMNKTQVFLDSLKLNLKEERMLIGALNESLDKNRKLEYKEIECRLHILISEYILDKDGKRNVHYLNAVEQLKRIC